MLNWMRRSLVAAIASTAKGLVSTISKIDGKHHKSLEHLTVRQFLLGLKTVAVKMAVLSWLNGMVNRECLLEGFFEHQALFYNTQTQPLSRVGVVEKNVKLGTITLGTHTNMLSNPSSTKFDRASRVFFKYSTSRGVYRISTFYVNGFILPDAGSPLDFGGWKSVLDALVQTNTK
ncbi:unnamed protein product [Eruca vesicaria subsp. sativa]|uniref:Uncharacterized protein n=1 Tax=Eruca vesicaria subsp. sativa TaxID=29727 RepID=A0ABC8LWT8_ERUVS|nr:unnamed protein product [Eruca vesicaria subsp. sativa]